MDPDKREKVKSWPTPKNPEEVRKCLGFIGYYRRFVQNFAKIAKPLTNLMPTPKKKRGRKPTQNDDQKTKWIWETEQENAFQQLKTCLITPPILGYPDLLNRLSYT